MNDPDYTLEEEWLLQSYNTAYEQWYNWEGPPHWALSEEAALKMLDYWRKRKRDLRFRLVHVEKTVLHA